MHRLALITLLHVLCITSSQFAIAFTIKTYKSNSRHCNDILSTTHTGRSISSSQVSFKVGMTSTIIDYENEITEETNPM